MRLDETLAQVRLHAFRSYYGKVPEDLVGYVKAAAREVWGLFGRHEAQLLVGAHGRLTMLIPSVENDADMKALAQLIALVRLEFPEQQLALIVEAWLGRRMDPLPREDPEREEGLLFSYYRGAHSEVWVAKISGPKRELGQWVKADQGVVRLFAEL